MSVVTLEGYRPSPRYDELAWEEARLEGSADALDWATLELFELDPVDADPTAPAVRNFTTETVTGERWLRIVFVDGTGDEEATEPVDLRPVVLASRRDVAARLGRELTEAEGAQVDWLVEAITDEIVEAAGISLADIADLLDAVPGVLRRIAVEAVRRSLVSPTGVESSTETIGKYSYTERFGSRGSEATAPSLTKDERLRVSRAVWGSNTGSVRVGSILDDTHGCAVGISGWIG